MICLLSISFTVLYGTFISDQEHNTYMSQVLVSKKNRNESLLFQDLYFVQKPVEVKSSVNEAVCEICKKGLDDSLSVTATTIDNKIRLYCDNHFPR